MAEQLMMAYLVSPSVIRCEGRTVTGAEPIADLCSELLRAGFSPRTGIVVRETDGGPIIQSVRSIESIVPSNPAPERRSNEMSTTETPKPNPDLDCGLPDSAFNDLRNRTALGRLSHSEAKTVFDALHRAGFAIVPKEKAR